MSGDLLRFALLVLAKLHMLAALVLTWIFLLPEGDKWFCLGERDVFCVRHTSLWRLQHVLPETIAYSIQTFFVVATCTNFASCLLSRARAHDTVVAILNALTFVLGIIPWALSLGFRDQVKGYVGPTLVESIGISFVHMVAACLSLVAIYMPDKAREKPTTENPDVEKALLNEEAQGQETIAASTADPSLIRLFGLAAMMAQITASLAFTTGTKDVSQSVTSLGAQGCQLAAWLLSMDSLIIVTMIQSKKVDLAMGSLVASSLSLIAWIVGIVACALTTISHATFSVDASLSLASMMLSVVVFGIGLYLGIHEK